MRHFHRRLVAALLFAASGVSADIYQCEGEHGETVFSQIPCGSTARVSVRSRPSPAASGIREGEAAWLAERQRQRDAKQSRRVVSRAAPARSRQAEQCTKKRLALSSVNAELRRGYKPAKGEKLRRRRRSYEDYLSAFCR